MASNVGLPEGFEVEYSPSGLPEGFEVVEPFKGIDLTPSGLAHQASNILAAPFIAAKEGVGLKEAYDIGNRRLEEFNKMKEQKHPLLHKMDKLNDYAFDTAVYSKLPFLRAGAGANLATKGAVGLGNAAIQGGIPGLLEGAKEGQALEGAGVGTGIAGAINAIAPRGLKFINEATRKALENPAFQKATAKTLQAFTSVPEDYTKLALEKELAGNSILNGVFDADTAYRPIEQKLREAKGMLPTDADFGQEFYKQGQKAIAGIEKLQADAGQKIQDVLGNISKKQGVNIEPLRNKIQRNIESYAMGGDYNPVKVKARKDIQNVYDALGIKSQAEKVEDVANYLNNEKLSSAEALRGGFDKEKEDIAFSVLAQATGKDKKWLKSQLNAAMPKMSTQKRQEFIQELLDGTADKIDNIDPSWAQYFPELNSYNLQGEGAKGEEIARNMFDRIMGKNYISSLATPEELAINQANKQYDDLLGRLAQNPTKQGYNKAFEEIPSVVQNLDETTAQMYIDKLGQNIADVENILNPQVKPIDLHNLKETLYDTANYETAGGIRNNALKGMANDINQYLRNLYPEYRKPNDAFATLKNVEYALGGPAGINANTIGGKLSNYGSKSNIESGLDNRLKAVNDILPPEYQFLKNTKDTIKSRDEIREINRLINGQYERNPKLLANRTDEAFENALTNLQTKTGINFIDDLNATRAREALEKWFPGQGGGSGSEQGFGNLLRTSLVGGLPTAAALTHNPATLFGLLSVSPKFTAQGTIKNLGRLYNTDLSKYLNPEVRKILTPMLIQGVYNE